jgi:hypothetical protein
LICREKGLFSTSVHSPSTTKTTGFMTRLLGRAAAIL